MKKNGALAHLARAFDWQSRGGEFESRMLHKNNKGCYKCGVLYLYVKNIGALRCYLDRNSYLCPKI